MPTNTIKHRMLMEAKRIANKEYSDKVEKVKNLATLDYEDYIIPASAVRDDDINNILKNHPEYDEDTFRGMIRTFQKKDNSNELSD